jgi:hypothetical protein
MTKLCREILMHKKLHELHLDKVVMEKIKKV